jgi:hypothetical protein
MITKPLPASNRGAKSHQKRGHIGGHLHVMSERKAGIPLGDMLKLYQQQPRRANAYLQKKIEKKVEETEIAVATIEMANGFYPREHFPQFDALNPDKAEFLESLRRMTHHMRNDADQYQYIYNHITDIAHLFPDIEVTKKELQEAIKCVRELPKNPTEPEAVHNALRKISSAARTVIFLQKTALELQQSEIESLKKQLSGTHKRTPAEKAVNQEEVSVKLLPKQVLQSLRDEVRGMVFTEQPIDEIALYKGKDIDGTAIDFLKKHYAKYITYGNEVIFANDLAKIDDRLLRAIRNEARYGVPMPLGTVSDLSKALANERFVDGKNTRNRVQNARWRANAIHAAPINP